MSYIIATWNKAAQLVQSQHWNCGHSELCWHSAARSLYYATIIQCWVKGKCQFPALDGEITLVYVLHKATFTLCTERCILPLYPHHLQLCIAYLVKNQLSTIFLSLFSLTNCKSAGFQHQTDGSPLPNVVAPTLTLLQIPHVTVRTLFTLIIQPAILHVCRNHAPRYFPCWYYNWWRIRFAKYESGFGLDSVKPSIQCANPNPDSRIQFWRGFTSKTGSA